MLVDVCGPPGSSMPNFKSLAVNLVVLLLCPTLGAPNGTKIAFKPHSVLVPRMLSECSEHDKHWSNISRTINIHARARTGPSSG